MLLFKSTEILSTLQFALLFWWFRATDARGKSFVAKFQASGKWSNREFLEFDGKFLDTIYEFTACHWENLNYFSTSINTIWNYCDTANPEDGRMRCINAATEADNSTAGRSIIFRLWIDGWTATPIDAPFKVSQYHHRSWNHFCLTYSSRLGEYELYHNGASVGKINSKTKYGSKGPALNASKFIDDSAILLGQEPDKMRGDFDPTQSFNGDLAEFNIWDTILERDFIEDMAKCKSSFSRGNLISWTKNNFKISSVDIEDINETEFFCRDTKHYVIVPNKVSLYDAKKICSRHGSTIAVPHSKEDNEAMVQILAQHTRECVLYQNFVSNDKGKGVWLGFQKLNGRLIESTEKDYTTPINFTNWGILYEKEEPQVHDNFCPFMYSDGLWGYERLDECERTKMCFICSYIKTPVFTLKGQCPNSSLFEWNYYMTKKANSEFSHFEGFTKSSKIVRNGNGWKRDPQNPPLRAKSKDTLEIEDAVKSPVGRFEWDYNDQSCSDSRNTHKRNFTFSKCEMKSEFTCSTGHCVDIVKRCNGILDCMDGSDEEECSHVDIPKSYRKIYPPEPYDKSSNMVTIHTQIILENVDFIDTHGMKIGCTLKISMEWKDGRLRFKNINGAKDAKYLLSTETSDQIWLPLDHVRHTKAEIGTIQPEPKRIITAYAPDSYTSIDPFEVWEDLYYIGNNTRLEMTQRLKIHYKCHFHLTKYPFDQHTCEFGLGVMNGQESIKIRELPPATLLTGNKEVKDFEIVGVKTNHTNESFSIVMQLKRNSKDQILTLFGPTVLFWFLAYLTLYFNIDDINNRSRTSVTVLLVLISLLSSVKNDFPKTTYFKYVDLWFFWYVGNTFVIISLHIILENVDIPVSNHEKDSQINQVSPFMINPSRPSTSTTTTPRKNTENAKGLFRNILNKISGKQQWLTMEAINTFFKVVLPLATIIFNLVYFNSTGAGQDLINAYNSFNGTLIKDLDIQ